MRVVDLDVRGLRVVDLDVILYLMGSSGQVGCYSGNSF